MKRWSVGDIAAGHPPTGRNTTRITRAIAPAVRSSLRSSGSARRSRGAFGGATDRVRRSIGDPRRSVDRTRRSRGAFRGSSGVVHGSPGAFRGSAGFNDIDGLRALAWRRSGYRRHPSSTALSLRPPHRACCNRFHAPRRVRHRRRHDRFSARRARAGILGGGGRFDSCRCAGGASTREPRRHRGEPRARDECWQRDGDARVERRFRSRDEQRRRDFRSSTVGLRRAYSRCTVCAHSRALAP